MAVVVTAWAATQWAQQIIGQLAWPGNWSVHLFVNFYHPTPFSDVSDFKECSWPGYSPFAINSGSWVNTSGFQPVSVWAYPLLTWVFDPSGQTPQTVFGYWVEAGGHVLYAEAFAAPFPIPPEGGEVPINLYWTDEQCAE
jgi:hypothetical protein